MAFEFLLAASQGCLIGLNFIEAAANFSQFLSGFTAETDWLLEQSGFEL